LHAGLDGLTFASWLSGSLLLYCLIVSIQFPLYFKYDFSKLAAFTNLPFILIGLAGSYVIKKNLKLFGQTVIFFIHNPYMIWLLGIAGGLLLLVVSTYISIALYKTREYSN
jgi:ABC-2 type transport system permease protein